MAQIDNAPWFLVADVAEALGLTQAAQVKAISNMPSTHVRDFRVAQIDNAPWFVASDVSAALGINRPAQANALSEFTSNELRLLRVGGGAVGRPSASSRPPTPSKLSV